MRVRLPVMALSLATMLASCGPSGPAPKPPAPFPSAKGGGATGEGKAGDAGVAPVVGEARGGAAVSAGSSGGDANAVKPPPAPQGLSSASSDAAWMQCGSMQFPKPASWKWVKPTAPFRTLQYALPGEAELIVSVFPAGDGGAVDANVERWAKQFGGAASVKARGERMIGAMRVTRVDFEGDFKGMGMAQSKPGMAQLGAIVQGPKQAVFVRVLGEKAAVEAARGEFEALVGGVREQP